MQTRRTNDSPEDSLFQLMPWPTLATRLGREARDLAGEIGSKPLAYLRTAFLPDLIRDWLPIRVATSVGSLIAHPIQSLIPSADEIAIKRRRRFIPVLVTVVILHTALGVYVSYQAFLSPYAKMRVVNEAYRKFDPNALTGKLYYPVGMLQVPRSDKVLSLEEIQERARKRHEQARLEREKAEKEKKEREEAARKAEEAAKLAAAEKAKATPKEFGKINLAPIKDAITQIYSLYKAGSLGTDDLNFTMMAKFKIEPDGSLSNIAMIKSSGSKTIDNKALEILWMLGESHALGPIASFSSNTIKLDLNDNVARLTITAFAPTPDEAKAKASMLNLLLSVLKMTEKKDTPEVAELLGMMRVRSENNRVDADLTVPRERANELMRTKFGNNPPQ
jgi:TonB-like protein